MHEEDWNYFQTLQNNLGSMLSEGEKENLKALGEKFYADIDMEKYKPLPVDPTSVNAAAVSEPMDSHVYEVLLVSELERALKSGLPFEELSENEQSLFKKYF